MSRYDKNVTSVRNICKILGYRLVGYDPDWSIAVVEEKLPNNRLVIMAHQMRGQYDQISDEFMGRLALLMGFNWIFEINDNDIRKLIDQFNDDIKDRENRFEERLQKIEKTDDKDVLKKLEDIKKDDTEYIEEIKTEYNEKIQFFEAILRKREKLRRFLVNEGRSPRG